MEEPLKRTCLHDSHVALGAQMSTFAGYDMPIQYAGIIEEHNAVRRHCGMFDVSHMGEIVISGPQSEEFTGHVFTNDVRGIRAGKVLYGMMLYPDGGVVDDLLVYKMDDQKWLLVVNASNVDKDFEWLSKQASGYDVRLDNLSDFYGEIALQGPEAEKVTAEVLGMDLKDLEFYTFRIEPYRMDSAAGAISGLPAGPVEPLIVSRTGYTGEDGFEFYAAPEVIVALWDKLLEAGVTPCGLGCRDTLRFEVGLPLYGHELSAKISPIEAGLGIFVKTDKEEFIGKESIVRQKAEGTAHKIVGIELTEKAIPRAGYPIECEGKVIGEVTTGYQSISTGKYVCMALIDRTYAEMGRQVEVRVRKKTFAGTICKKRFYDKNYKK